MAEGHQGPQALGPDEPGQQHQRVRFDEDSGGDEAPGSEPAPVLCRDHGAQEQQRERQVELAKHQLLDQELAIQQQGHPQQRRHRHPTLGKGVDGQSHQCPCHRHHESEPDCLSHLLRRPDERHHECRERGQVLELVVTVVRSIQRLVGQKARGRESRDGKVDELWPLEPDHGVAGGGQEEDDDEVQEERPQSEVHKADYSGLLESSIAKVSGPGRKLEWNFDCDDARAESRRNFLRPICSGFRNETGRSCQFPFRYLGSCRWHTLQSSPEATSGAHPVGEPTPYAMLLTPGSRLGPYEIEAPFGAGGMGEVFRACDTRLNRPVAIKFLSVDLADPSARRRFQQEAQTASALNHPHILTVHEAGEFEDRQYLVTEFIDGGTLKDWALREKRTWRQIVELLVGVADGLAAAHALRHPASRYQTGQHPGDQERLREAGRLRAGEVGGALAPDDVTRAVNQGPHTAGPRRRHHRLHVAGTGIGEAPRRTQRHLFVWRRRSTNCSPGRRPFDGKTDLEVLQTIIDEPPKPLPQICLPACDWLWKRRSRRIPRTGISRCGRWWWICVGLRGRSPGSWPRPTLVAAPTSRRWRPWLWMAASPAPRRCHFGGHHTRTRADLAFL